jgi:hypothetical protein
MPDINPETGNEMVVTVPEVGSRAYLKDRLRAFGEGMGPGKSTNIIDQRFFAGNEILKPAFNTKTADRTLFSDSELINLKIDNQNDLEWFKKCGAYFAEIAIQCDKVALDGLINPTTGEIDPYMVRNADCLILKVGEDDGGKPGEDNYVTITFFWDGVAGVVDKPKQGTGQDLKTDLRALGERLDGESKLLLADINFITRKKMSERSNPNLW